MDPSTEGDTQTTRSSAAAARRLPEYDASLPGTGAQRVAAIAQLYVRVTNSYPLTITVVDALCLAFGAGGATIGELASYLALSESAVRAALEGLPQEMRCTSADLEDVAVERNGSRRKHAGPSTEDPYDEGDGDDELFGGTARGQRTDEPRHFLNYKRILSVAYAHVSHMLLALCVSPLPSSPYTDAIKRVQMEALVRSAASGSDPGDPADGLLSTTLNISPTLRKREALDGIYCPGCQFYFALQDFAKTVSRCPTCQQDVLRALVLAMQTRLDALYTREGRSLVIIPGTTTQAGSAGRSRQGAALLPASGDTGDGGKAAAPPPVLLPTESASPSSSSRRSHAAPAQNEGKSPGIDCALARDPFLVQQALAFLFLYSTPFASLSDSRCVVDPDDILTEPEYESRLKGKASIADEFRALHRNASKVRVRLVSQKRVDEALREANTRKIAKRANLPPWLKHTTTLASLEEKERSAQLVPKSAGHHLGTLFDDAADGGGSVDGAQAPRANANGTDHGRKRSREGRSISAEEAQRQLRSQARFVAKEFFEDDFDAVTLPRYGRA